MTPADLEREASQYYLLQTGGNRQQTAELLKFSTRMLVRKLQDFHNEPPSLCTSHAKPRPVVHRAWTRMISCETRALRSLDRREVRPS